MQVLRNTLNCTLPIELVYNGEFEMNNLTCQKFEVGLLREPRTFVGPLTRLQLERFAGSYEIQSREALPHGMVAVQRQHTGTSKAAVPQLEHCAPQPKGSGRTSSAWLGLARHADRIQGSEVHRCGQAGLLLIGVVCHADGLRRCEVHRCCQAGLLPSPS